MTEPANDNPNLISPVITGGLVTGLCCGIFGQVAVANPIGMSVANGTVNATQNGAQLSIQASHNAWINWQSFNIRPGETTSFIQPSAASVVWNRIFDANPCQIWGNLNANGYVVLMNQNGFYFGPNSVINVGGLVVTTATPPPGPSGPGGFWQFNGAPPLASIVNYGEIKAHSGGSLFLLAERVENHGVISAPGGQVRLEAGKEVLICDRPDGRGISASVRLPEGTVDNSGKVIADAGKVALHAQVVNQNGLIQANSVREHNGVIELVASDAVNLGKDSLIQAKGDTDGISSGGSVAIKSAGSFSDASGSRIAVNGGDNGGNGGSIEISGASVAPVQSKLEGGAKSGWKGGSLLFDPTDILLSGSGDDSANGGTIKATGPGSTLRLNVNSAFYDFSSISLQATRDITLDGGTFWNLNDTTGHSESGSLLTLEAGRHITFGDNSQIFSSGGWSVRLAAGVDFSSPSLSVKRGVGGIYLNGGRDADGAAPSGSGAIEMADGSISLEAGHEVLVGSGYIRTSAGGSINIKTGDGDVDAGSHAFGFKGSGFDYKSFGEVLPSGGIGGIGTMAGGNVSIDAGRDITSFGPVVGAFGAGDVILSAGRKVLGSYGVRNGHGVITAGVYLQNDDNLLDAGEIASTDGDIGSGSSPINLSLISGSWKAFAGGNIFLNEVFNPNGSLNQNRSGTPRVSFRFNYSLDASVSLAAGDSVNLLGSSPIRRTENPDRPPIYPPQLEVHAGAGGILLGNDLVLFPSALGRLIMSTTDGGSFRSAPDKFFELVMSDSGSSDYKTFAAGHASTPLHQATAADPVQIAINGSIENLFLRMPKQAHISAGLDAVNFSFEGQNLTRDDNTAISIGRDFRSRSDRTFVALHEDPNLIFLDPLFTSDPDLIAKITYDPASKKLGFIGRMSATELDTLLNARIRELGPDGRFLTDADGNPYYVSTIFSADQTALNKLYTDSQDVPTSSLAFNGLQVGGPGKITVSARNMDLGISHGIRSIGALLNPFLGSISLQGAAISLDLLNNLDMTSSQIASFNGGQIDVKAGGDLNVGSKEQFTSDDTPKGIYTGHGGDVNVTATGKVAINGSRISSYDGGNISVVSETGDVDAGAGAKGFFAVTTAGKLDPLTGLPQLRNDRFFGSGILALTRPDSETKVGNIRVKAGKDILANSGGVLQLAFNRVDQTSARVDLEAGGDIVANQSGGWVGM